MDCIDALKTRRSVRAYTGAPVSREIIEDVVDCGRLAATARNDQPWEFVVVTGREMLGAIGQAAEYGGFIAQSAFCVVVFCKDSKYYLEDGSNASQNMLVAARAHGIAGCWVAGDKKPHAPVIANMLGAPAGYKLVSLLSFGVPADTPKKPKRALTEVLHWEKF
jgi:nitroreductase